jgi:hypothetical protein
VKETWRKTVELLRAHPIFWLPLIGVDLSALYQDQLRKFAAKKLAIWLMTVHSHSALGGDFTSTNIDHSSMTRAALLAAPLTWGSYFLRVCLYTAGFLFTATLVRMVLEEQKPSLMGAFGSLRAGIRQVLWFSTKLLAVCALIMIPCSLALGELQVGLYQRTSLAPYFLLLEFIPLSACIAWLIAPAGMQLIQSNTAQPVTAEVKRLGRLYAIFAAAASAILGSVIQWAIPQVEATLNMDPWLRWLVVPPVESLLTAIPYLLLWVVLTLLVSPDLQMVEIPSPS